MVRIISLSLYAFAVLVIGLVITPVSAQSVDTPVLSVGRIHSPTVGRGGMVSSQEEIASRVGADILARGGNAVDAAVATAFALAVVRPQAGNIGGGGFMLVYLAAEDRTIAIDYREMAPAAAHRDMYLDENGNVDNQLAQLSHLSSGVPGTVAGMHHALEQYGTMEWADVIAPAIRLATEGFPLSHRLVAALRARQQRMAGDPAVAETFYDNGAMYEAGHQLVQADLAHTLTLIAEDGPSVFYEGEIADLIVAEMESGGGLITHEDLANYEVVEREAVTGTYRGYGVASMPPPSSGGIHVIQMLNILENFDLAAMGAGSAEAIHVIGETMRMAFADRAAHLGDPDFWDVPVEWLTSKEYARELAAQIELDRARPSSEVSAGDPYPYEGMNTTHYSVMDAAGNVASNTFTLNFTFGSGKMVDGAGFFLNDQMDDFSSKPGSPNGYGLIGGEANAIEAGKRPLSSMTPVIIFRDGEPWFTTGGRGGSRIITAVLQVVLNVIDFEMNIAEATYSPRVHHQWLPDILQLEPGISPDTIALLAAKGHTLGRPPALASTASVMKIGQWFYGVADDRRPNGAAVAAEQ